MSTTTNTLGPSKLNHPLFMSISHPKYNSPKITLVKYWISWLVFAGVCAKYGFRCKTNKYFIIGQSFYELGTQNIMTQRLFVFPNNINSIGNMHVTTSGEFALVQHFIFATLFEYEFMHRE